MIKAVHLSETNTEQLKLLFAVTVGELYVDYYYYYYYYYGMKEVIKQNLANTLICAQALHYQNETQP